MWQRRCLMGQPPRIFTAEHEELRASVRRFVDTEVRPHVDEWERGRPVPRRGVPPLRRARLPRPALPGALGRRATATSPPDSCSWRSSPSAAAGAIPMAISVQTDMATPALAQFGTDDQRSAGSRPRSRATKIARDRDHRARRRLRRGRDLDPGGARRRRVARQRPQDVHHQRRAGRLPHARRQDRSRRPGTAGSRCSSSTRRCRACRCRARSRSSACTRRDTAEIALDDVAVPHADLIGLEPGRGFAQLMWQLQYERLAGAAASVGHAAQALAETIAYAGERQDVRPADRASTR